MPENNWSARVLLITYNDLFVLLPDGKRRFTGQRKSTIQVALLAKETSEEVLRSEMRPLLLVRCHRTRRELRHGAQLLITHPTLGLVFAFLLSSRKYSKRPSQDFASHLEERAIQDIDISHQVSRLRNGRNMSDGEAELIIRSLWACVHTHEQVVEVRLQLDVYKHCLMFLSAFVTPSTSSWRIDATLFWPIPSIR